MDRVDARDASALLELVSELRALDDPLPFPPKILRALQRLIPGESVGYSVLDPSEKTPVLQVEVCSEGEHVLWGEDEDWLRNGKIWWSLRATHPVCGYRARTGDWTTPLKVTDFVTQREFRRTPIYQTFYRGSIERWLDVGLRATPTRTRVLIFTRDSGPDYDERDRLLLTLLRPHLERRAEDVERATEAAAALAAVEESASEEARLIVVSSAGGVIEFASPSARKLLQRYLGIGNGSLPTALLQQPELIVRNGNGNLTIRVVRTGELRVLLLDERDLRLERLTARERDVLERVAEGRTNAQIASELGIASPTVAKHLEHVYEKLDVRTRTAAAALLASG